MQFLGVECVAYPDINIPDTRNEHLFFALDQAIKTSRHPDAEVKLARQYLFSKRGVVADGKIYFRDGVGGDTEKTFLSNQKIVLESRKRIKENTPLPWEEMVVEEFFVPVINAIFQAFVSGAFTQEECLARLSKYFSEKGNFIAASRISSKIAG